MGRIILFLVVALVVYMVIKGALRRDRPPSTGAGPVERMVACTHCQVHLPASEALQDGAHYYCSEEHRRLGAG